MVTDRAAGPAAEPVRGLAADRARGLAADRIRRHGDALVALSRRIHARPETAFAEHRAAAWCAQELAAAGLDVRCGGYGMPTAFEATAGTGPVTVVVCCEYDALPELGHACGHNLIAAYGVGAGIGLAAVADAAGLTVKVLGTPAEESGGGKVRLLEGGAFAGVAAAMLVHPAPVDVVRFRSFARSTLAVEYHGRAAHAAVAPHRGRNAGDAVTVAQVAIGLLRQQLPAGCRVHGIVTHGGDAYNVIPARATARYAVRAQSAAQLTALRHRVEDCFQAGARAAACQLTIDTPEPDYLDFRTDAELAALYQANAGLLGRPVPVDLPPAASTDMANVSHAVPSIHPTIGIDCGDVLPHDPRFAAYCVTPAAERTIVDAATAMAWTAIDLAARRSADPNHLASIEESR
jgi:amidohydrolase